ncbi:MAG: aminoglycoside N(3)-acetyltransferase [Planctomycetota bacterium]
MGSGGEARTVENIHEPVTVDSLESDFVDLGVREADTVLVHASLRSLGWVCGGAVAVNAALRAAVGPHGTIVMPAHSAGLSDPATWMNPPVPEAWWPTIRATLPAFDPRTTPTRRMGAIAELFRTLPGVLRSDHPTSSVAAAGPNAERIIESQMLDDPAGANSPLAALYDLHAKVLLLGVGHDRNTSLHLAERRAFGDAQVEVENGAPVLAGRDRIWIVYREPVLDSDDFVALGADLERRTEAVTVGRVGSAETRLMDQRTLVDFAVTWFQSHRKADGTIAST